MEGIDIIVNELKINPWDVEGHLTNLGCGIKIVRGWYKLTKEGKKQEIILIKLKDKWEKFEK